MISESRNTITTYPVVKKHVSFYLKKTVLIQVTSILKNTVFSVVIDVNYSILAIPSDEKKQLYSVEQQIEGRIALPFKQSILLICDQRNDLPADDVRLRVRGSL